MFPVILVHVEFVNAVKAMLVLEVLQLVIMEIAFQQELLSQRRIQMGSQIMRVQDKPLVLYSFTPIP